MHVFGRWEEAGENPRTHGENMQTPHRKNQLGAEPGTLCCEATVLTRMQMCYWLFSLFQLLYMETEEPRSSQNALLLRSSVTPTKKVDVDRTIMPDGTIVTTVTTVQSRLKLDRSPGRSTLWSVSVSQRSCTASGEELRACINNDFRELPFLSGDSPLRSPSKVEVTEKKATVLSDGRGSSSSPNPSSEFQAKHQFYITDAK